MEFGLASDAAEEKGWQQNRSWRQWTREQMHPTPQVKDVIIRTFTVSLNQCCLGENKALIVFGVRFL